MGEASHRLYWLGGRNLTELGVQRNPENVAVRLAPGRGARRRLFAREPRIGAECDAAGAVDDASVQTDVVLYEPVPALVVVQRHSAPAAERVVARLEWALHRAHAGRSPILLVSDQTDDAGVGRVGERRHAVVVHRHRIAVGKDAANDAEGPVMEAMRQRENRERRQAGKARRHDVLGVARSDWRQRSVAEPTQVPSARRQSGARAQAIERGETQHGAASGEPRTAEKETSGHAYGVTSWHAPSLYIHGRNLLIRDRILADVAALGVADVHDRNEERLSLDPRTPMSS